MQTKLYYIAASDKEDTNLDLMVEAESAEAVRPLWEAWVRTFMDDFSDAYYRVFEVPDRIGSPVIHEWSEPLVVIGEP